MENLGKICLFDEDEKLPDWCVSGLSEYGYEIFVSSNLYQFLSYSRVMFPHLLVINMANGYSELLDMMNEDDSLNDIPIAVQAVSDNIPEKHERISHFLIKPVSWKDVDVVASSYCAGGQQHDVLLIDDYDIREDSAMQILKRQALNCFEVHNLCAAQKYLQKNSPRGICVCLPYEECQKAEEVLQYDKIFYVENPVRLKNIATLLS